MVVRISGAPRQGVWFSADVRFLDFTVTNGDFINGNVFVHKKCYELMHEYETLIRDDKGHEDPNLPNDLCDATLYAYREAKHYAYTKPEPKHRRSTEAYMDAELERESEDMEKEKLGDGKDWWDEYGEELKDDDGGT